MNDVFKLTEHLLLQIGEDAGIVRVAADGSRGLICGPICVAMYLRDPSRRWGVELAFRDRAGGWNSLTVAPSLLHGGRRLAAMLVDYGFKIHDEQGFSDVLAYLHDAPADLYEARPMETWGCFSETGAPDFSHLEQVA